MTDEFLNEADRKKERKEGRKASKPDMQTSKGGNRREREREEKGEKEAKRHPAVCNATTRPGKIVSAREASGLESISLMIKKTVETTS